MFLDKVLLFLCHAEKTPCYSEKSSCHSEHCEESFSSSVRFFVAKALRQWQKKKVLLKLHTSCYFERMWGIYFTFQRDSSVVSLPQNNGKAALANVRHVVFEQQWGIFFIYQQASSLLTLLANDRRKKATQNLYKERLQNGLKE